MHSKVLATVRGTRFPSFLGEESGSFSYVEHRVRFELVEHDGFEEWSSPSALVLLRIILYLFGHVGPGRCCSAVIVASLHRPGTNSSLISQSPHSGVAPFPSRFRKTRKEEKRAQRTVASTLLCTAWSWLGEAKDKR